MARGSDLVVAVSFSALSLLPAVLGPTIIDQIVKPDLVAPGNRVISLLASTAQLQNEYPNNAVPLTAHENTGSGARSNEYYTESGYI